MRYEVNRDRLLKTFLDLVKIPSPSFQEEEVGRYVEEILKSLGMKTTKQHYTTEHKSKTVQSFNIVAVMEGDKNAEPIFFSAHLDTVEPCNGVNPQIEGDIIKSDGTTILGADDKAGVVAILEMLRTIKKKNIPHPDIWVILTSAEEVGLTGSKNLDPNLVKAKKGYVLDADGDIGRSITGSPTHMLYTVKFTGRSAHAGVSPEKGINAVLMASEFALKVPSGKIADDTVANVGKITGGSATNIVPEVAVVEGEYRSHREEAIEEIKSKIQRSAEEVAKKYGGKVEVKQELAYKMFRFSEDSDTVKWFRKACENLGIEFSAEITNGGSDASILNEKRFECILLSSAMYDVHSKSEWTKISELEKLAQVLVEIVKNAYEDSKH